MVSAVTESDDYLLSSLRRLHPLLKLTPTDTKGVNATITRTTSRSFSKGYLVEQVRQWESTSMYCFVCILRNEARGNYGRTAVSKMFQSKHTSLNPLWSPNSFLRDFNLCCINPAKLLSRPSFKMKLGALTLLHLITVYSVSMCFLIIISLA